MKTENIKDLKNKDNSLENVRNYERAIVLTTCFDEEIISLAKTAKSIVVEVFIQKIKEINPATYFGIGKLYEILEFIKNNEIDCAIFDGDLTPSQTINISEILGVKVIDRTTLILDIFALNAVTGEGKLQVELAQLKRLYPRLKGKGASLSRLGGGIGTRGPGESKLETDRRHIKTRILYLEKALDKLSKTRDLQINRRKKDGVKSVALVGYTNSGKTTLLSRLTDCDLHGENKLFATLDTKGVNLDLGDFNVIIFDTVGFIKNIPTTLIEAFKSTLSVALEADLLLNVCDLTQDFNEQINTTVKVLEEIGCKSKILTVFNKCDESTFYPPINTVVISAKTGTGLDDLKSKIKEILYEDYLKLKFNLPYDIIDEYLKRKKYCEQSTECYFDDVVLAEVTIKRKNASKFDDFIKYLKK